MPSLRRSTGETDVSAAAEEAVANPLRGGVVYSLPPTSAAISDAPLASAGCRALLDALRARDEATARHSEAVAALATRVARALSLPTELVREAELTGLLHDVGKLGVPDRVLRKRSALDEEERAIMRAHSEHGERLIRSMPGLWQLGPTVRASHERWDGGGYPDGLRAEEIPLASRVVAVCDAYEAMTGERIYRAALLPRAALAEIRAAAGTQFCPASAAALLATVAGPFRRLGRSGAPPP